MKDQRYEILDELLARIEAGESIEECLAGLPPAEAQELRASLQTVLALRVLRHVPPPRPEVRRCIRAEVLARAAEAPARPAWSFPIPWRWSAWAMGAIVALVLLAAGVWQYGIRWQTFPASSPGPAATQIAGLVSAPVPTSTPVPARLSPTPPAAESPTPPPALPPSPTATMMAVRETAVPVTPSPSPTPSPVVITPVSTPPAAALTPVVPTPTFTPMPTPTPEPPSPTPTLPPPPPPAPTQPPPTSTPAPTPTATEPPPTPTPAQTAEPGPTFVATLVPASEPTATPVR